MSGQSCINCHQFRCAIAENRLEVGDVARRARGLIQHQRAIGARGDAQSLDVLGATSIGLLLLGMILWYPQRDRPAQRNGARHEPGLPAGDLSLGAFRSWRSDEIGAMAEKRVERFKIKAIERARGEAERDEAIASARPRPNARSS